MDRFPITAAPELSVAARFRITLGLAEAGIEVMRGNLRRKHPAADDVEIGRRLAEWMRSAPAVGPGDPILRPGRGRFGES